ncbi:MAG: hypothetical protein S4CHLAM2_07880 [Chlamydiales bacterium]|nr:hypothetical protein [Chlamydiales bacterium]
MSLKGTLTNETLTQRFDNPFALVNYAISLAKNNLSRGEESESNPATQVLETIASNYDMLQDEEDDSELVEDEEV